MEVMSDKQTKNKSINFSSMKWEGGSHIKFDGKISDSLIQAIEAGMYSFQIFIGNPQSYNRSNITTDDMELSAYFLNKFPTNLFIHTPLVYNLAGKKDALAWAGNNQQDTITQRVVNGIQYELSVLSTILSGVDEKSKRRAGVVVHPGSYPDKEKGLEAIGKTINKIEFIGDAKLLLENASGGGTKLATTFQEIRTIIDHVDPKKRDNIGVCVDTAHIFGFGSYDLRLESEVDRLFQEFDDIIGAERFTLLHLNDSKCSHDKRNDAPFGSGKDKHQLLGHGYIWNDNLKPLLYLLNKCKERDIPVVLETEPCDMVTLMMLSDNKGLNIQS
jgi:deoxyribonuclease-4